MVLSEARCLGHQMPGEISKNIMLESPLFSLWRGKVGQSQ